MACPKGQICLGIDEIDVKTRALCRLFTFWKTGVLAGVLCFFLSETRADTIDFSGVITSETLSIQFPPSIFPLFAVGDSFEGSIDFGPSGVVDSFISVNSSILGQIGSTMGSPSIGGGILSLVANESAGTFQFESSFAASGFFFDSFFAISVPATAAPGFPTPPDNISIGGDDETGFNSFGATGVINSVTFTIPESGTTFTLLGIGIFCLLIRDVAAKKLEVRRFQ